MKLTPFDRKVFELYQKFRTSPPTVFSLVRMSWGCYVPLIILAMLLVLAMAIAREEPSLGSVMIGVLGGMFWRDVMNFQVTKRFWPALSHVLDWEKIEDALSGREEWS